MARHQLVAPRGARAPDWAAKIHIAVSPVYYHTYLYGAIVALQLKDTLDGAAGGIVGRPEAGAFLAQRLFAPGSRFGGIASSSRRRAPRSRSTRSRARSPLPERRADGSLYVLPEPPAADEL